MANHKADSTSELSSLGGAGDDRGEREEGEVEDEHADLQQKGVRGIVYDFWETSTLQGLPRVFTSRAVFWRVFWLVMFLLLMAGCVYQMWSIFTLYYSRETTTSFELGYDGHLDFPSVTVCNVNRFRQSQLLKKLPPHLQEIYINGTDAMRMTIAAIEIDSFIENTMSIGDRLELGHQQNRSIIYRAFPKASPTANLAAGSREFSTQNSYLTGNCFTFNGPETSNESVIAEGIGQEYGLFMVLDAESDEYTTYGDFTRPQVRGFRLDVHTHNTISEVNTAPIMVSTGSEVHINIKQSVIERLEAPYGECDREYERSYEEIYGYQYNLLNCREACLPYQVLAVCGCYHSAYTKYYSKKHLTTHRKCDFRLEEDVSTVTDYPCVHDVRRRLTTDLKCTCPLACRETRYAVDMSSLPIQQTMFPLYKHMVCFKHSESECSKLENIPEDQQLEVIRRNVAYVHIYYLDLVYDHYIQKKAYDRSQFISDFGGNLGLWLGASIVTILEFIELFTKLGAISIFKSDCKCSKKTRDNVCASPRKGKRKSRKNNKQALPLHDVSNA